MKNTMRYSKPLKEPTVRSNVPVYDHTHSAEIGNLFLDTMKNKMQVNNDSDLARILKVSAPSISKIRSGSSKISSDMVIRASLYAGISIENSIEILGVVK